MSASKTAVVTAAESKGQPTPHLPRLKTAKEYSERAYKSYKNSQHQEAIVDCTKAIELDPEYADAYYDRARARVKTGHFAEAYADFKQAENLYLEENSTKMAFKAREQISQLIGNHPALIVQDAIAAFSKTIEKDPQNFDAYSRRGTLYINACQYQNAIADFTRVITFNSKDAAAYFNRALAFKEINDFKKAHADLKQAKILYSNSNDPEKTRNVETQIANLEKEHPELVYTPPPPLTTKEGYYQRALKNFDDRHYAEAIADLNVCIRLNSKDTDAYYHRALAFIQTGNFQKAYADFIQIITLCQGQMNSENLDNARQEIICLEREHPELRRPAVNVGGANSVNASAAAPVAGSASGAATAVLTDVKTPVSTAQLPGASAPTQRTLNAVAQGGANAAASAAPAPSAFSSWEAKAAAGNAAVRGK